MDKELALLEEIHNNNSISQREVADKIGLSLGSVNLLLKKMIKEGLIKMEQIPANRVAYMLTPRGMVEKAGKTYNYIVHHYNYIEEQKMAMKNALIELLDKYENLQLLLTDDPASEILRMAFNNLKQQDKNLSERIIVFTEKEINSVNADLPVIVLKDIDLPDCNTINILEII